MAKTKWLLLGCIDTYPMEVLSMVPCLWECFAKKAPYIKDLEDNLNSLRTSREELNNLSQDVKQRVKEAEEQQMKRTNQVNGWLERVEAVERQVNEILQKGTEELENRCLGRRCPKNCWSSYKLGKKVMKMVPEVKELLENGRFDVIADKMAPPPVDELPMENTVLGFESKFQEIWHSIEDRDSTITGLVGIGGVGKTTLLKQLNNEFLKTGHGFDLVIWLVISKPVNLGTVRDTIGSKLNISEHLWENISDDRRVSLIFNKLKEKKFVVLLDDLWERFELSEVGIPQPCKDNGSKVVFTTRSREVCRSMEARKVIEVSCLPPVQAFSLFCSKVGEDVLKSLPKIRGLVKDVVSECQGLPLALIAIGRAMRNKTEAQQWTDAKRALEKYPSTFPGMEGVFSRLVFSYDSLPTLTLKKCFEYCSIFPEDHDIEEEEIIKLWLAERLVDEYDDMYDAFIQGRQIIESLMQAGLLETGQKEDTLKMHDVMRDMALWLACERGEKRNKFWVNNDRDGLLAMRSNAEKVSLWGSGATVESFQRLSFCSNLDTLIIRNTNLRELPGEASLSMKVVRVLDLSCNEKLMLLPARIGGMLHLEYLNIVNTDVRRLPAEVDELKKLRFLLVCGKTIIPRKVISSLLLLQMFEQSNEVFPESDERVSMEKEMIEELEGLKHIMDLRLVLYSAAAIQILLKSPKLQSCTTRLSLRSKEPLPATLDLGIEKLTKNLKRLEVENCDMSTIQLGRPNSSIPGNNIRHVKISFCGTIRNVSSLIYAPNLCTLSVSFCDSLVELIGEDAEETWSGRNISLFSHLRSLTLWHLSELRSICPQSALSFPLLRLMTVYQCESLRKLPFDSNTANTIPPEFKLEGLRRWWNGLEWDSQATKDAFTPKFVPNDKIEDDLWIYNNMLSSSDSG